MKSVTAYHLDKCLWKLGTGNKYFIKKFFVVILVILVSFVIIQIKIFEILYFCTLILKNAYNKKVSL